MSNNKVRSKKSAILMDLRNILEDHGVRVRVLIAMAGSVFIFSCDDAIITVKHFVSAGKGKVFKDSNLIFEYSLV